MNPQGKTIINLSTSYQQAWFHMCKSPDLKDLGDLQIKIANKI